jgi:hypothetical protein
MLKGRTGVIILIVIAVAAIIFLVLRGGVAQPPTQRKMALPMDLQKIIPTNWKVVTDQYKPCDFDNDGEEEWLIIYRYAASEVMSRGLIGGVIYDAQGNRVAQAPGNESPYRPAFLIPYKLLPDIYTGKGQGYLGESGVVVRFFPPEQRGQPCRATEITIQGFSDAPWPTRLSIFRWAGERTGYVGVHFVGNARIADGAGKASVGDGAKPIVELTTFNRLNDRSALCAMQRYERSKPAAADALPPDIVFTETAAAYTIDFCFGPPNDPAYPEGAVVALLRGNSPKTASPTGETYLTVNASLPPELNRLRGSTPAKQRILSVTHEGIVAPNPADGQRCDPAQLSPSTPLPGTPEPREWWCGRERARVITEIILDDQHRIVTWSLLSIANERINIDMHWRIEEVELR